MATADYALIISLFSACLAMASFVWNVWSKFIYPKPKVRLNIGIMNVLRNGRVEGLPFVNLQIVNHGPGSITIELAAVRMKQHGSRKLQYALINPIHNLEHPEIGIGPFAGGLPKVIETGEKFALHFPYEPHGWLDPSLVKIGVLDSYGRYHWVGRGDLNRLRERHKTDFAR